MVIRKLKLFAQGDFNDRWMVNPFGQMKYLMGKWDGIYRSNKKIWANKKS